jgi:acid stress-induced BolA-like protein IbaG/YrbA
MDNHAIAALIEAGLPGSQVQIADEGCALTALVVNEVFAGKSLLQKHQLVMATVKAQINSGELHALSVKAFTPEEWAARDS